MAAEQGLTSLIGGVTEVVACVHGELAAVRSALAAAESEATELRQVIRGLEERNEAMAAVVQERERELGAVMGELAAARKWQRAVIEGRRELDVQEELRCSEGERKAMWQFHTQSIQSASANDTLDLSSCSCLSDAVLGHVSTMTHLKTIHLGWSSGFTSQGIRLLYKLPHLEQLYLSCTAVSDSALEGIGAVTSLAELCLMGTRVTDVGLLHLTAGLSCSLTHLWLSRCQGVTCAGMRHVARLTGLEWLGLEDTGVGEDGLQCLTSLTRLTVLRVPRRVSSGVGVAQVKHVTALERMGWLWESGVSEEGDLTRPGPFVKGAGIEANSFNGIVKSSLPEVQAVSCLIT